MVQVYACGEAWSGFVQLYIYEGMCVNAQEVVNITKRQQNVYVGIYVGMSCFTC